MAPQQPVLELTELECRIVTYSAKVIQEDHIRNGTPDRKRTPKDGLKITVDGIGAELAVAKFLGLYPKTLEGYSRIDDMDKNGLTIDVKNRPERGDLLVPVHKVEEGKICDIYILTWGSLPSFTYVGFAYKETIINKKNMTDLGYGPTYLLEHWKLSRHIP